ncbi:hypothetical protein LTR84_011524 [Exophiala bonariae]|uniref:YDG domain-containing protein n=1 Tax=Exophiala bonariae TaxID=1690606 RepID=A0AAV9NGP4_9EURO|nr:hypothetical protein LTR84_011524 [Exophiala bonariae]
MALPPDTDPDDEDFMTLTEVQEVVKIIDKISIMPARTMRICNQFRNLEEWIRRAQYNSVTREVLDQSLVLPRLEEFLSDDHAPTRVNKDIPVNLVENLTIIYRKWDHGDLSVLARRGLIQGSESSPFYPDPDWSYRRSADFFGHGHLVNGQTWNKRVEMSRDGAHAPFMAGIYGTMEQGAKSIVMGYHDEAKKEFYADIDQGERIWYIGTGHRRQETDIEPTNVKDEVKHEPGMVHLNKRGDDATAGTKALITSYRTKRPVRVFRSFRLAKIVEYRPVRGFRYDGLYKVVGYELLKQHRQIYRFELVRLDQEEGNQGPLRENLPPPKPAKKREREDDDDSPDECKQTKPPKHRATGSKGRGKKIPAAKTEK